MSATRKFRIAECIAKQAEVFFSLNSDSDRIFHHFGQFLQGVSGELAAFKNTELPQGQYLHTGRYIAVFAQFGRGYGNF
ncbi:hypothetical protein BTA35_0204905 [Oceanospirillum linum]|uniref:Uncharacterized protein n=1 Tax=Oceanospirillum linum TaxID=966 RepID=A0A1T1HG41_OCELI|nr:hypothetical protein BTA35_0204905 [Oceanospirillum linum]